MSTKSFRKNTPRYIECNYNMTPDLIDDLGLKYPDKEGYWESVWETADAMRVDSRPLMSMEEHASILIGCGNSASVVTSSIDRLFRIISQDIQNT